MDANMIANIETNYTKLSIEMCAIMDRITTQAEELAKFIKEQPSRKLLSDIKNDDIQDFESITVSLEEELSSPTLDKDKGIMECDKMPLILEGEFQDSSLVKNNELTIEEELSLKEMQIKKKHLELIVENVLVRIDKFNFPINSFTFGMEKNL